MARETLVQDNNLMALLILGESTSNMNYFFAIVEIQNTIIGIIHWGPRWKLDVLVGATCDSIFLHTQIQKFALQMHLLKHIADMLLFIWKKIIIGYFETVGWHYVV